MTRGRGRRDAGGRVVCAHADSDRRLVASPRAAAAHAPAPRAARRAVGGVGQRRNRGDCPRQPRQGAPEALPFRTNRARIATPLARARSPPLRAGQVGALGVHFLEEVQRREPDAAARKAVMVLFERVMGQGALRSTSAQAQPPPDPTLSPAPALRPRAPADGFVKRLTAPPARRRSPRGSRALLPRAASASARSSRTPASGTLRSAAPARPRRAPPAPSDLPLPTSIHPPATLPPCRPPLRVLPRRKAALRGILNAPLRLALSALRFLRLMSASASCLPR
jgi:hypothetical protein